MLIFNYTTQKTEPFTRSHVRCLVDIHDDLFILGYCSYNDPKLKYIVPIVLNSGERIAVVRIHDGIEKFFDYSKLKGRYFFNQNISKSKFLQETNILSKGGFPFDIEKHYEAVDSFNIYNNKQDIIKHIDTPLANYMKYTFGAEFETCAGYIPQDICFRDGLIPLRDGSLDGGIEYSTIVLQGAKGLDLLAQQVESLQEYTWFNRECALHFHFGGYPVTPQHIFSLYMLCYILHNNMTKYLPPLTFNTTEYKKHDEKNYCAQLDFFSSFEQMFFNLVGKKFMGSLTMPHPADRDRHAKWNIHSRYKAVNFINMLCYKSPKTVEFRFLRPTYNMHKILLWLYIFNAILSYAESIGDKVNKSSEVLDIFRGTTITIEHVLYHVYPPSLVEKLLHDMELLAIVVANQTVCDDLCGEMTQLEDKLINPNIII